jgi:type I restriction enzyme S subunit
MIVPRAVPQIGLTAMRDIVTLRETDTAVAPDETYHFAGVYCFGRGVFAGERKTGLDFAYRTLTRLRAGDFVYPKLMAWEGALGIVPPSCDGLYVSPEYPVFALNSNRVLPETLDVYFRSPLIWPELAGISTGTNVRRRRLHPKNFLAYQMPLPPMETQERLREVKAKVDSLKALQAKTAAELDALLPSVLDKAFKGEL